MSKWAKSQNGPRVTLSFCYLPQPLKESKLGKDHYGLLLFTPWQSETCSEQQEINKQQGQNGQRVTEMGFCYFPLKESKWGCCCLPPDRVKLMVNSKKKQTAGYKSAKSQNGPRVKMGFCSLPPDRVKLAVNSKKNKQQGSRWASVIYPVKESNCAPPDKVKLTEQQERNIG